MSPEPGREEDRKAKVPFSYDNLKPGVEVHSRDGDIISITDVDTKKGIVKAIVTKVGMAEILTEKQELEFIYEDSDKSIFEIEKEGEEALGGTFELVFWKTKEEEILLSASIENGQLTQFSLEI